MNTTMVNTGKAQLLTFADGSVGKQRGDGTYDIFLTDANEKLASTASQLRRRSRDFNIDTATKMDI